MTMQFEIHSGKMTCIQEEWTLLDRGIDIVVILKIYYRQKIILITLLLINKQSEILVKFLIDILCLSI